MVSISARIFLNCARFGLYGIVGIVALATACTETPKPNTSTGGQGGSETGGSGGAGGAMPQPQIDWTVFTESADTQKIYVSNGDGNDANDGSSPEKAVKTLAKGISLLRDGKPDWMLLKRGDVWLESLGEWKKSGRSATEPMLVTTYGDQQARPILKTGSSMGLSAIAGPLRHISFVGLHFYAHTRDPESSDYMGEIGGPGIQWIAPSEDLLFEDLVVQFYAIANIQLQASMLNVRVRRSILVDSYSVNDNAQGLYADGVKNLLIEENVFDHNGWNSNPSLMDWAKPTIYNHNLHVQPTCDAVTIRGNLSTRASSHGIQARAGGFVTDNLVLDSPVGIAYGSVSDTWEPKVGGVSGTVSGNVIADAGDIDAANTRGIGLQLGNIQSAMVENNILAHDASAGTSSIAIDIRRRTSPLVADEKVQNMTVQNNIVYDWRGGIRFSTSALTNVLIQDNDVQEQVRASEVVNYFGSSFSTETKYSGNHWFSVADAMSWFTVGANSQTFDQWLMTSGEQNATNTPVNYTDVQRRLAEYHGSLGKTASFDAYMAEVRQQSQKNWRVEYTPKAVISYIRQGFGKK